MDRLKDFLWPVVLVGGFGALIDFLIGRAGQAKTKDLLLKWWVRFDDIRWTNFGSEEALFAGRLIERHFGKHIWSLRRIISALVITIAVFGFATVVLFLRSEAYFDDEFELYDYVITMILAIFGFIFAVSFTKYITLTVARMCGVDAFKSGLLFTSMLILNYGQSSISSLYSII